MGQIALLRFPNSLFQCAPFIQELPIRFDPAGVSGKTDGGVKEGEVKKT